MLISVIWLVCVAAASTDLGEVEVGLEFMEFDFEDHCLARNDVLWKFHNGNSNNLSQLIIHENITAEYTKSEVSKYEKYKKIQLDNPKIERLLDILTSSGPSLLPPIIFTEYTTYGAQAQAFAVRNAESKNLSSRQVDHILRTEKNASILRETWIQWVQNLETSSGDLGQQLSLLDLEAEVNGAESAENYWLQQSEVTITDYEGALELWNSIVPLYQKLRQWLAGHIAKVDSTVFLHPKLIPVNMLGSLDSADWVTAAEKLKAFEGSMSYKDLRSALKKKSIKDLYECADDITAELKLGYLPDEFFQKSQFEDDSEICSPLVETLCKSEVIPRVFTCKDNATTSLFLRAHEDVAYIKRLTISSKEDAANGFLFREGPRDSVLYEAISAATSLLALSPVNLERRKFYSSAHEDANITSLLLSALHIIPAMPLHLSYDVWRLQALKAINPEDKPSDIANVSSNSLQNAENETTWDNEEEDATEVTVDFSNPSSERNESETSTEGVTVYDQMNLTSDWWTVRGKLQGVSSPDLKPYADYLYDKKVIWNKPYLSKFLAPIVLFQILENFKSGNTTENLDTLKSLLKKGKAQPWEQIVVDFFNITQLDTKPLLKYFKPLETFLDNGGKFNKSVGVNGFLENDFKLFLTSATSDGDQKKKDVVSASEDSDALMVILIGLAVIGSIAILFSIVKKRYNKRQRAKRRRKMDAMCSN